MNTRNRSRRSRSFRPSGFDVLETRSLLAVDPTLIILPDPVADFDPNDVVLVDLATFQAHLMVTLEAPAFAPPAALDACDGETLQVVLDKIDMNKDLVLRLINERKTFIEGLMKVATDIRGEVAEDIQKFTNDRNALADNPANAEARSKLQDKIDTSKALIDIMDAQIDHLFNDIIWLNDLKDAVERSVIRQREKVWWVDQSADPDPNNPIYWYYVDQEMIA